MLRVAIVGYGNIGRYALEALRLAPDMELAGVVRRSGCSEGLPELEGVKVSSDIKDLGKVDVAILSTPSRKVEENAIKYLSMGISTVDSFDIHSGIRDLRATLDPVARKGGAVSIISAGWDPGSDSVIRTMLEAVTPQGTTWTNFGPGRSMGHSVIAAGKPGVVRAVSITVPEGKGRHSRMVYIELEPGASFEEAEKAIKEDPYFANDPTTVKAVPDISGFDSHMHGVNLVREGVSGVTEGQKLEFNMRINNPALTGQMLVSACRAASRQTPGCYTMIEIPPVDFLPGDRADIVGRIV